MTKNGWLRPGLKLLVACSGGVDSTVLLHLLMQMDDVEIHIFHLNHQLRGDASDSDEEFVRQLGDRYDIPVEVVREDISKFASSEGLSIEEAGSIRRNAIYRELSGELGCDYTVTGHQFNDQLETILINLYLGAGIRGTQGMHSEHGGVIRPLLEVTRSNIMAYALNHEIEFREDASNQDTSFLRNQVRSQFNTSDIRDGEGDIYDVITHLSRASCILNDRIDKSIQHIDNKGVKKLSPEKISLGLAGVPNYFSPIKKAIFDNIFRHFSSGSQGLSQRHYEAVNSLIPDAAIGKVVHLPQRVGVVRDRHKLIFLKQDSLKWEPSSLEAEGVGHYPFFSIHRGERSVPSDLKDPDYLWLPETRAKLTVRMIRAGDKLATGPERKVSINQILQEAHVAPHVKEFFPVVSDGQHVLWVPGVRTAYHAFIDDGEPENRRINYIKVQFDEGTFE